LKGSETEVPTISERNIASPIPSPIKADASEPMTVNGAKAKDAKADKSAS
jgi:hypothetical protein